MPKPQRINLVYNFPITDSLADPVVWQCVINQNQVTLNRLKLEMASFKRKEVKVAKK